MPDNGDWLEVHYKQDNGRGDYLYSMTCKYLEQIKDEHFFSLRPEAGTTSVKAENVISMIPALKQKIRLPKRLNKLQPEGI